VPTYVCLMSLTEKGIKEIKNAPEAIELGKKNLESVGGKLLAFYTVMGDYDYVAIAESPDDETAMGYLLGLGAAGLVRTTTLKAFTLEQFKKAIDKI